MSKKKEPSFKTRARILYQLGEQLIKSESIALLELVKNSYDADASWCKVYIEDPDNKESGKIIIEDSGSGMNREILEYAWLEIGTDDKAQKKEKGYRTPIYNRVPLGEKGIGRFGVHRLGRRIELITRMEEQKEYVLRINWDKIDESKYIEDLPIIIEEREPLYFKNKVGTKIEISKFRNNWTRGTLREIARAINSLNSPFNGIGSFSVYFNTNYDWLNGILSFNDIKDKNLFKFELKISKNLIVEFSYDFLPYKNLTKVSPRHVGYEDFKTLSRMVKQNKDNKSKLDDIDISKYKIGDIYIKGIIFDLDSKILNIGLDSGIKDLKNYLTQNGGIQVFRDNMRIWDYGESDNDWLDLEAKRVNNPSFKLGNKQILAAVYLDSETSKDLIEQSNREGFVNNDAFIEFRDACTYAIEKVEMYRNEDKEKLRRLYTSKDNKEIPVLDSIEEVKEIVRKEISDDTVSNKIYRKLDRISTDYTRITDNLIKSAGAGLNLIAVLHQIEKLTKELKAALKNKIPIEHVSDTINYLEKLVIGYSILSRNYKPKYQELKKPISQALENEYFRFKTHKVKVVEAYKEKEADFIGFCSENYLANAVMNLIDNSIWWLQYGKTDNPKIYVDLSDEVNGFSTIVVADNGPGFSISKDELGHPFVTAKPSGIGMGIGLHIAKEIMIAQGGKIIFPDSDDFEIPEEFRNGAIVALAFKKEK